jgi:hypothetical protein
MTKEIKCSRCRRLKIVPINWQFKECVDCHERTVRRTRKTNLANIERKALESLINFEKAYRDYKKLGRKFGKIPQSKEEFRKSWVKNQQTKIEQIKQIIQKYDDSRCPIQSHDCFRFRILLSERNSHVDFEAWSNNLSVKDWNFFHNHIPKCESCNQYYVLHQNDVPIETSEFHEATQEEFEKGIDDFFESMKPKGDIDDIIHRAYPNLKPCCSICGSQLIDGQCPNGH